MTDLDYSLAGVPVRDDLRPTHRAFLEHLRASGTWWSGAQRVAWGPIIEERTGPQADLYGDGAFIPNIVRALSLVPDEVRMLRRLSDTHYLAIEKIPDPTARRALDRMQMELVAARVSALNEC